MFRWLQAQLMADGINALQDVGFVAELQQGTISACFRVVNGVDSRVPLSGRMSMSALKAPGLPYR